MVCKAILLNPDGPHAKPSANDASNGDGNSELIYNFSNNIEGCLVMSLAL